MMMATNASHFGRDPVVLSKLIYLAGSCVSFKHCSPVKCIVNHDMTELFSNHFLAKLKQQLCNDAKCHTGHKDNDIL